MGFLVLGKGLGAALGGMIARWFPLARGYVRGRAVAVREDSIRDRLGELAVAAVVQVKPVARHHRGIGRHAGGLAGQPRLQAAPPSTQNDAQ